MKKIALFLLSCVCFNVHADYNLLDYTNCSALDLKHAQIGLSLKDISEDYIYRTQKYSFLSVPIAKGNENYCLIINDKNKVIVDAIPKMISNLCGGMWDKQEHTPVWIDDTAGSRGLVTYFHYNSSDVLKNINKNNKSEIKQQIAMLQCQLSFYTIDDVIELNDTAFYLYQLGYHQASLKILKKVIKLDPNRTVAYLNTADVYVALNNQRLAKQNYLIYANNMKKAGLTQQIPKRILKYL
ncbi:tetratricopeptide repeat protein [Acinetobacter sp.]|uniref:tetratricopeptide repeat protein n=1 Tax=Acinetobacter sp. TaxID=472 RepID=UPI002588D36B|nr:tetratricopeptide repeat protein [Acinetobacter sp.]